MCGSTRKRILGISENADKCFVIVISPEGPSDLRYAEVNMLKNHQSKERAGSQVKYTGKIELKSPYALRKTNKTTRLGGPLRNPAVPTVEMVALTEIRPNPDNVRSHSKKQIGQLGRAIKAFGLVVPIIIDENGTILAGHARFEAAKAIGLKEVPALRVDYLSDAKKIAYTLADNKIAQNAGWDREKLFSVLGELSIVLIDEDLDLGVTGFSTAELDSLHLDFESPASGPLEDLPILPTKPVTRLNDRWLLGEHRIICGDARHQSTFELLLQGQQATMIFTDPPYNVRISGHVGGRGRTKHREFAVASGELSASQFVAFLQQTLGLCAQHSINGSIHYICMDWRHSAELLTAGQTVYDQLKNICVWVKNNAGQGSFYRSQHEFVFVFKNGDAEHLNTFELGQHGRTRTNVWNYAGVNSFRAGRMDDLQMHPTVKPTTMIVDAMKDCSKRGSIVLDAFLGSGTTLVAAEQIGRRAYGIELDPGYVDVSIERWHQT
jgi:DNA modification methylase